MVDGEDVNEVPIPLQAPACSARWRVPTRDGLSTADKREAGDVALCGPSVAGDETVLAIRAGHGVEGLVWVVVAGVVGDCSHGAVLV